MWTFYFSLCINFYLVTSCLSGPQFERLIYCPCDRLGSSTTAQFLSFAFSLFLKSINRRWMIPPVLPLAVAHLSSNLFLMLSRAIGVELHRFLWLASLQLIQLLKCGGHWLLRLKILGLGLAGFGLRIFHYFLTLKILLSFRILSNPIWRRGLISVEDQFESGPPPV